MKLRVSGNKFYADNLMFSQCESNTNEGIYEISIRYSHEHERDLPYADGLGWVGSDDSCAIVLGRVLCGDGKVIPCFVAESRLISLLTVAEDLSQFSTLEIRNG